MSNKVTSLNKLKEIAKGEIVVLPGWGEEDFVCRVKRISMLSLVKGGKIPNPLLNSAQEIFMDGAGASTSGDDFKEMTELLSIFIKESLVEPSLEELEEIGLELTDEQVIAIFNYSQHGAGALKKFRGLNGNNKDTETK